MAFGDTITEAVLGKVSVPEDTDNAPNVVAEGAAVNTTVGITAQSTFANGNAGLDYSLSADSSGGGFKIDPNTGVVTVADPSKIDFESAPGHAYTITVLATKNNNFSSSQTFTISVNDVAPSAPVDSNAAANTVLEGAANGTAVGITASSSDVNGGAVTYSLIGDTSAGGFTINATTGVVTVADGSKIDFESAPGHAYTVTVQSSDGTLTSSQAFTINVGDVAMTTPVDTNGATNSVAEGAAAGTAVGITAQASDPSGPATTYSLIGDTSGGGFTINASTGVVTVANPAKIDFESTAPGHTYNITVQASNGVQTTSQVFTVGVTDVAPSAPTDSNGATNTVAEGAAPGTVVGVTASSTDVNGGAVTYSLIGDTSGGGFTINATTGVVSVTDPTKINFETAPGHAYTVTVQSSDGTLANSQTFTIAVTDVAPTAPVDSNGATNTVAEGAANGSTVGITASSTDVNGPGVTYSLVGDTSGGGFTINSTTGVITVADGTKLDYETTPSHAYTVTAQASDGTLTNSQTFTIALTDVAPTAPVDINGAANTVAEGAANGSTVGITASSVDPNGPATTYSLTDNAGGRFAIDPNTGVVTVANGAAIDFETAPGHAYGITVLATNGALTTSSAFSIGVTDVGPSTPVDANGAPDSVFEGAANGTVVGITASSTDPGGGPAPTYTLTDNAGGRFAIDSTTGVVTVANGAAIDFETAPGPGHSYGITVQSTAGALSSTHTFSIGVGDVNEAPAGTDKTVTMLEGDSYTFSVADFGFSDPSDSVNPNSLQAVKMTTVPGAGTGTFTNNGVTVNAGDSVSATDIAAGHLVFTPTAHSNGSPEASFTFQVQDNGGTANGGVDLDQSPNTVAINVSAVNDAPINSVPGAQSVNEDTTLTFSAGNGNAITISDIDVGSGNETVTLTVTNGTLALGSHAGLVSFSPDNAASITLTGTVANVNAAMDGLTYHGNLNFNGTETLVVSTNDNGNTGAGGPQIDSDPVTINVAAVNDAPVNTVPGLQTVNEDTALVFNGANTISISDVDANGGTETVTLSVTSGALTLSGTTGLVFGTGDGTADSTMTFTGTVSDINTALNGLSYQGNLNFNGSDTLNITTNDNGNTGSGGALTATSSVGISVTAVNDAPSFTVGGTQNALEDSGAHTVNGFATGISPGPADEAGQTVNFLTSNDNNALFSVGPAIDASGNLTYTLAANANGSATVTVQLHDNGGTANGGVDTSAAQTFVINAAPVNDAPAGADNTLTTLEDTSHTFTAAEFGFTDPVDAANASGANNFASVIITTIPGGAAGTLTDNGVTLVAGATVSKADIDGGLLKFNPAANANGNGEAAFTFQVKDDGGTANLGVDTDQSPNTMTFNVTSVNDAPAGTDKTVGTAGSYTFGVADFGFSDPLDAGSAAGANAFQAVKITTSPGTGALTNNGVAVNAGDFISVTDIAAGHLVFTPTGGANDSFTFQVQDNGGLANGGVDLDQSANTFTIDQNIAPTITAGDTLNYTENATSVIDPTITITDPDNANMASAKVAITTGFDSTQDVLAFTPVGAITGSYNPATGVLTLSGSDTKANYELALESVTYHNTSDDPTTAQRTVTYTVNDGTVDSAPGTATINVNAVNDAPVTTAGGTLNYTENQAATVIDSGVTATDVDNANLASATVAITGGFATGQDVLDANVTGTTIGKSYNAATGVLTLTGSDTKAHYQQVLDSVTYFNSSENPSGATRTVSYTVNDGAVNSNTSTATVNVTPVNDAPVTTAGGTLNYTENQAATVIDAGVTATDVDNANLASATVAITGGFATGQDVLDANVTGTTIGKSYNAATGVLTLTGSDTKAHYQQVLDSVTYFNSSENPSGAARTVSYTVNDGAVNSNTSTATVNVTPVNDAPVVTIGATTAFSEPANGTPAANSVPVTIAPSLTVTDVDSANLTQATFVLNNLKPSDALSVSGHAGASGDIGSIHFDITSTAGTETVTFTGTDTIAHYNAVLDLVQFNNTSENPDQTARSYTVTAVDDGTGTNTGSASTTETVTAVNDAPINTVPAEQDTIFSRTATAITGLSVSDVDSGAGETTVLSVAHGTLNVATVGGGAAVTNNGTTAVTLTGTAEQIATTLAASNGVVYTSGAFTGTDVLTVTTNDNGATGTGAHPNVVSTENLGVIPKVWFIDNTASAVGADGSQAHPFNSIAAFNAVNDGGANHPQTNDYIYLKTGTGVYSETDGIHLLNGQQLVGGGDGLTFPDPLHAGTLTIETAGTRPVIDVTGGAGNDAIHLAQDNTIHGFNVAMENAAATGIVDNGGTVGTLNISNMNVGVDPDGGGALLGNLGQAISITHGGTGGSMTFGTVSSGGGATGIALGGTLATNFSATGGTLSGHSTSEVAISGGSGTVSYGGTIGDGSGLSASVSGRTAGTVTLSGNINDGADAGGGITVSGNSGGTIDFTGGTKTLNTTTGNAVALSSNTGATIDFTGGGLNIDTTSGTGFSASTGTVTVTGLGNTINTTSGTALSLSSLTVGSNGVTFDSATTTSAATGISIDTVTGGAINVNGGSIAGATTRGVDINAAQNNISIASSIASTGGHSVEVTNSGKVGGNTISFSGAVTDSGGGINLDNNDQNTNGATINFSGGLNIHSTTNTGFNATNGGTVNVTNGANNSIVTTTGTALNVVNTTIGSSGLTFHDISSNGAANGIVLNNTGTSGGLTVTGDSGSTNNSSGGTIQNTTGDGVSLTTTQNVSLDQLNIQSTGGSGVNGVGVTNFALTNSTVNNSGNALLESNIAFNGSGAQTGNSISGTLTITGNTLTNAFYSGVDIQGDSGTITNANISNNTITSSTVAANTHGSGIDIAGTGNASTAFGIDKASINNNVITNFPSGDGINFSVGNANASGPQAHAGTIGSATNVITINNNTIHGQSTANPIANQGIAVVDTSGNSGARTQVNAVVSTNDIQNTFGTSVLIGNNGYSDMAITVDHNTIVGVGEADLGGANGIGGGNGVGGAGTAWTPHLTAIIESNNISQTDGNGILMVNRATNGEMDVKIDSNTVAMPTNAGGTARQGIRVDAGNGTAGEDASVFLNIFGNTTTGSNGAAGIGVRKNGTVATTNDFGIFDAAGGPSLAASPTNTDVANFINALNPNSASAGNGGTDVISGNNYLRDTTNAPALLAAAGGVAASTPTPGEMHLSQAELDSVVAAAIGQWAAAGASASQLAALHAVTFSVADLSGSTVGEQSSPIHITIDTDAAGHGWFVDPTPNDNSEFTHAQNAEGTDLLTDPSNAAAGHLDLLTTVTHELGHVIGLDDRTAASDANDLMYINLVDGERRLPDATDVAEANGASTAQAAEAALPVSAQAAIGTAIVAATAGNDTIDAGHGGSILFGGAGADNFVFGPSIQLNAPTPAQVTHVADYSAAQGDTFDFSAITSAFHNSGVNDSLVVRAVEDASGKFATLQVDHIDPMGLPSAPNWVNVAQLDGAHSGDAVNVLIDSHSSVHLAQIHVDLLV
jgi:hypothetical protein